MVENKFHTELGDDLPIDDNVLVRVPDASHGDIDGIEYPSSSAFANSPRDGDNLSCDWDKIHSAKESWEFIDKIYNPRRESFLIKSNYCIYSFNIETLLGNDEINSIKYFPISEDIEKRISQNLAHSQIFKFNNNDEEVRKIMSRLAKLELISNEARSKKIRIAKISQKINSYENHPSPSEKILKKLENARRELQNLT